jgi:hypothetical protein
MRILILLFTVLLIGCKKSEPMAPPSGELPEAGHKKIPVSIGFDLKQPVSDASRVAAIQTKASNEADLLRFRLLCELKPFSTDTVFRDTMLLDITTSDVVIEDTLPVDTYTLAVWGNYVYVDDQGRVVDEQYEADPEAGLENIRILHPEQEKNWGFAYAGTQKVSLSATTSDPVVQRIPIQRCVMQILFNRHGPYDNFDWNDAVASNIKLTGFSTHYNVYTDQASADADHPIIQLDRIDNREYAYYRMTLFESLQDCYIDLQYVNSDGSTIDLPQFYNKRQLYHPQTGDQLYKPELTRNKLFFFANCWNDIEPFSIGSSTDLMGDETIFEPTTFSCVAPEDSLALVDFYHAMGGETWVQPWRLALPVSTWAGITLSAPQDGTPQRVIAIKMGAFGMGNNNMKGYIPASLGELSELIELNIAADLEGGTEDFLGGLTQLKSLTISHSQRANFVGGYGERPKVTLSDRLLQLEDVRLEGVSVENLNLLWQSRNLQQVSITFVDLVNDSVILETADTPFSKLHTLNLVQIKGATGVSDKIYKLGSQLETLNFIGITTDNIAEHINLDLASLAEAYPNLRMWNK